LASLAQELRRLLLHSSLVERYYSSTARIIGKLESRKAGKPESWKAGKPGKWKAGIKLCARVIECQSAKY
tara:strand:- start:1397 stop:1606 length:210 start_codon:yes stop_codon:yes gene_type:complete